MSGRLADVRYKVQCDRCGAVIEGNLSVPWQYAPQAQLRLEQEPLPRPYGCPLCNVRPRLDHASCELARFPTANAWQMSQALRMRGPAAKTIVISGPIAPRLTFGQLIDHMSWRLGVDPGLEPDRYGVVRISWKP